MDYDDLIRLALEALQLDGEYLKRLQARWPYILEDEAQDSSRLQEKILRLLTSNGGGPSTSSGRGWVRVGDPNQAIFETFTTASPKYLRDFLNEAGVAARDLPNSGRSTQSIMDLANYLVTWSRTQHPVPALHDALAPTQILPTPAGRPAAQPARRPGRRPPDYIPVHRRRGAGGRGELAAALAARPPGGHRRRAGPAQRAR